MVFDEFRSQLRISDMLNYLDRYPLKLPSRYVGKQACYTVVYIISNEPLRNQYKEVQEKYPDTWQALLRRINRLCEMTDSGETEHDIQEYIRGYVPPGFREESTQEELPL